MEVRIDVSMLEPCEPLERTLEAIQQLHPGDYLRVLHRREPHLLYPLLEKSGFTWRCRGDEPGGYEVFIWKTDDLAAALAVDSVTE
jgi:uncharacterized protein (DUF2249 family)